MNGRFPIVIHAVRAALATYQWPPCHVMLRFAAHVGHTESSVRDALAKLIAAGEVERIQDGLTPKRRPRIIYQLTNQSKNHD